MKKILLTAAAAAVLSTSALTAFADTQQDTFYLKVNGNWAKLAKIKGLKSKNDMTIGVGAGYYVMDNARFDLTFDHFFNPAHKGSMDRTRDAIAVETTAAQGARIDAATAADPLVIAAKAAQAAAAPAALAAATLNTTNVTAAQRAIAAALPANALLPALPVETTKYNAKLKTTLNALMVNGYMDLGTLDAFKFFVGAGVGVAQVKTKLTVTTTVATTLADRSAVPIGTTTSYSSKQQYNLAFAGHLGAAYELAPGITGELAYSYKNMGKSKKNANMEAYSYSSHLVGVGVRFDM